MPWWVGGHREVNYAKGQFGKKNEEGVAMSTNAAEGMFSRARRFLRIYVAVLRTEEGYGLYTAEFVWRTRFLRRTTLQLEWRWHALWVLLRALRVV